MNEEETIISNKVNFTLDVLGNLYDYKELVPYSKIQMEFYEGPEIDIEHKDGSTSIVRFLMKGKINEERSSDHWVGGTFLASPFFLQYIKNIILQHIEDPCHLAMIKELDRKQKEKDCAKAS